MPQTEKQAETQAQQMADLTGWAPNARPAADLRSWIASVRGPTGLELHTNGTHFFLSGLSFYAHGLHGASAAEVMDLLRVRAREIRDQAQKVLDSTNI
jgi:hypothetical protein